MTSTSCHGCILRFPQFRDTRRRVCTNAVIVHFVEARKGRCTPGLYDLKKLRTEYEEAKKRDEEKTNPLSAIPPARFGAAVSPNRVIIAGTASAPHRPIH